LEHLFFIIYTMQSLEKKERKSKKSKKTIAKQTVKKTLCDLQPKPLNKLEISNRKNNEKKMKNNENLSQNRVVPLKSVKGIYNKFNVIFNGGSLCYDDKDKIKEIVIPEISQVNSVKYKTEVCKFWQINKCCRFNTTCIFAHGSEEVRKTSTSSLINYKTKKCSQFFEKGFCTNGKKCQFLHEVHLFSYKMAIELLVLNFFSINPIEMETLPKRPRLKIFENLTKGGKCRNVSKVKCIEA
jgi:hypothetical protein